MSGDLDSEVLLELTRVGHAMEVRAVSAGDGLEVSFTAPANASQADIDRLARSKLAYVRARGSGGQSGSHDGGGRGGIIA